VCVPWVDADTSTSSTSTFVGVASTRNDAADFDDGGYLETASTVVVSTTGEPNDADMLKQYDMAIDWARSDDMLAPTGVPTKGPMPDPNPNANVITSGGVTTATGNMVRYGGSPYHYYSSGYQPKAQMAVSTTYKRLRRRRHKINGPS